MISDVRRQHGLVALEALLRGIAREEHGNRTKMACRLRVSRRTVVRLIAAYAPDLALAAGANQHDRAPQQLVRGLQVVS